MIPATNGPESIYANGLESDPANGWYRLKRQLTAQRKATKSWSYSLRTTINTYSFGAPKRLSKLAASGQFNRVSNPGESVLPA